MDEFNEQTTKRVWTMCTEQLIIISKSAYPSNGKYAEPAAAQSDGDSSADLQRAARQRSSLDGEA